MNTFETFCSRVDSNSARTESISPKVVWITSASYLAVFLSILAILCFRFENGNHYANIYAHLFLYPVFSGVISVFMLIKGLVFIGRNFISQNWKTMFLVPLGASAILTLVDLNSKNYASWEVIGASLTIDERNFLRDHPVTASRLKAITDQSRENSAKYQYLVTKMAGDGKWSILRWVYPIGFFISAYFLLLLFVCIGLIANNAPREIWPDNIKTGFYWLSGSLVASLPFVVFRLIFSLGVKPKIYPGEAIPFSDAAIVAIYTIAFGLLALVYLKLFHEQIKALVAIVGTLFPFVIFKNIGNNIILTDVNFSSYLVLTVFVMVVASVFCSRKTAL
jgi:hypothetical protein